MPDPVKLMGLIAVGVSMLGGCTPAPQSPPLAHCGNEERPRLDCSSEVAYDGVNTSGKASVLGLGGVNASYEKVAVRKINASVARYIAGQTRLCREYNACAVSRKDYEAQAEALRARLMGLAPMEKRYRAADSEQGRKQALAEIYDKVVPAADRSAELTLKMSIEVQLPPGLAKPGGRSGSYALRPNEPLPTNARVAFVFETSATAYLYVFQNSPETGLTVLYPDPRIGTTNPIPGGSPKRIPPGTQRFRLNNKDIGTEWVYIAASREPIQRMKASLARVIAGKVSRIGDDDLLKQFTTIAPGKAPEGCSTRGLELDGPSTTGNCARSRGLVLDDQGVKAPEVSMQVRTDPGDDTIVKAFPFRHVTAEHYASALSAYKGHERRLHRHPELR